MAVLTLSMALGGATASAKADTSTSDNSQTAPILEDESTFSAFQGQVKVIETSIDGHNIPLKISVNGKNYLYDYAAGNNGEVLLYLPETSAYQPDYNKILSKVAENFKQDNVIEDADLTALAQQRLALAIQDNMQRENLTTSQREKALENTSITSLGSETIAFSANPIELSDEGENTSDSSDNKEIAAVTATLPKSAEKYGIAIGRIPNGEYVVFIEYGKEKIIEKSANDYQVSMQNLDGEKVGTDFISTLDEVEAPTIPGLSYDHWEKDDINKKITLFYRPSDGIFEPDMEVFSEQFYSGLNYFRNLKKLTTAERDADLEIKAKSSAIENSSNFASDNISQNKDEIIITSSILPYELSEGEEEDAVSYGVLGLHGTSKEKSDIPQERKYNLLYQNNVKQVGYGSEIGRDGRVYYTVILKLNSASSNKKAPIIPVKPTIQKTEHQKSSSEQTSKQNSNSTHKTTSNQSTNQNQQQKVLPQQNSNRELPKTAGTSRQSLIASLLGFLIMASVGIFKKKLKN
ncbi:hypothetical protein ACFO26_08630 [Lactococcus nasutitermitis]|uniref:Gram-positive cocci surface proteins LPxTG domain-containing protein n=1 Tax=Lactococcus nasutitermitis TaxID=1652957 RepID=A0ABV9JF32_9LACT|nr:hypothetical protein [Lactococcus nasutitermitis]